MADESLDEDLDLGAEKQRPWKKIAIIVLGVVLLLGVGGGAAWFFLSPGDETPAT